MARFYLYTLMLCIFTGFSLLAQDCEKLEAEGRFTSNDDDSLDLVKKELLFDAYRNLMTKKMNCMGLDAKTFWEKFDLEFEKNFKIAEENLKKTNSTAGGSDYEDKLRSKRMISKREFGSLDRLIVSYSILKMSRSPQYPNSRFINISGKVDTAMLTDLYYKYTDSNQKRFIEQMLLSTRVKLIDLNWGDIGVKSVDDFNNSLKDSWMKWLFANWGRFFHGVYVVSDQSLDDLEKIKTMDMENSPVTVAVNKSMSKSSSEQMISGGKETLKISKNAVWINFYVTIKKNQDNKILGKKELEYSGHYIIKDLLSGEIVGYFDFPIERKQYFVDEIDDFASSVASFIYNQPISNLGSDAKKMGSLIGSENKIMLELQNISSVRDIMSFNEELTSKGARLQLRPTLESYAGDKGQILLSYQGAPADLKSFLTGLKNSKMGGTKMITFEDEENPYVLKLINSPEEDGGNSKK